MKSVTDNSVQFVKSALRAHLEKSGHALEDLEAVLTNRDTTKAAELFKKADIGSLLAAIPKLLAIGGKGAGIVAGAGSIAGGTGIYGAYKGLEDTQRKIDDQEAIRLRLVRARRELEAQMASPRSLQ